MLRGIHLTNLVFALLIVGLMAPLEDCYALSLRAPIGRSNLECRRDNNSSESYAVKLPRQSRLTFPRARRILSQLKSRLPLAMSLHRKIKVEAEAKRLLKRCKNGTLLREPILRSQALSQWGITWTFDREYRIGAFGNGDFWVAPDEIGGAVRIISISPDFDNQRNGWEVNPNSRVLQGFDLRIGGFEASRVPTLPYDAHAGESIVKAISVASLGDMQQGHCGRRDTSINDNNPAWNTEGVCLDTAAVLTVLGEPLADSEDYFRPPYVAAPKQLRRISALRTDRLPMLPKPEGTLSLESFADLISRVQLDHFLHWGVGLKPLKNYRTYDQQYAYFGVESQYGTYGANISMRNNDIALRLMLDDPIADKRTLLIHFVQQGLDLAAMVEHLHQSFSPGGGHGQGRLLPILFAGLMVDDPAITELSQRASTLMIEGQPIQYTWFGEGGVVRSPITGQALYGEPTCWDSAVTFADYEHEYWLRIGTHSVHRTCADPYGYIDGGEMPAGPYQGCCSTGPWVDTALAMSLMSTLKTAYGHSEFFEYTSRWMTDGAAAQPDLCAPARGTCSAGPTAGQPCTTANQASVCGSNEYVSWCVPDFSQYGVTFGPSPSGGCIEDQDSSDGIGRFPLRHGLQAGSGWSRSRFAKAMYQQFERAVSP